MNSIQRVLAALTFGNSEHGVPDRVPVFPVPLMQGAHIYKCSVDEYFHMPAERIANAQIEINHMFDGIPDAVAGFPNVIQDVTGFGLDLVYHYANSTPAVSGMLIQDFHEINNLTNPDPTLIPQLRKTLDTISLLQSQIGSEKVVLGACIAPFSLPSMLMGTSKWMRLLFTPELRRQYFYPLIDICQTFVQKWASAQFQAGAHVVVLADGMASATMLPRHIFEEFALPVIRETLANLSQVGMVAYEAVGKIEPFINVFPDLGAIALLIVEEDNIQTCKHRLHNRIGLVGNVNNMKMRRWSSARIEMQAKAAINQGKSDYGFILGNQGPELPFDVGLDGIEALIRSVEKYGRYDAPQPKAA